MAESPLDKNVDNPVANQTSSGIFREEIDRGIIIDHSSTRREPDNREDGHSKADVQRYPITNCICKLANEERNEGVATSSDPMSSSALESRNYRIHRSQNISSEELGMHDEARDNLVAQLGRPSIMGKSIGIPDYSCSPTLIPDVADDRESYQDSPNGGGESLLKLPSSSGAGRSDRPYDYSSVGMLEDDWRTAIMEKDCKRLLQLWPHWLLKIEEFEEHGCFWKISRTTALHIASMQGCYPLAKLILGQMCTRGFFDQYIAAVEPRCGLTALQMAHDVTGNRSVGECIKDYQYEGSREPHLFATYPRTHWYSELCPQYFDSDEVIKLLRWNSRLLLETYHGVPVFHLAIFDGCIKLVDELVHLFGPEKNIKWGDSYYPSELTWEKMCEINTDRIDFDGLLSLETISTSFTDLLHTERTALQLAIKMHRFGIVHLLEQYENLPTQGARSHRDHSPKISESMIEFLQQEWNVHPEWEEEFMKDVDFNFEVEPRLSMLRFHHACKDPLKFKAFLLSAKERFGENWTHDGQGRTMYHILLDHYTDDKPPGWALEEIFGFDPTTIDLYHEQLDARGRNLTITLLTKNYLLKNILIQPATYFSLKFQPSRYDRDTRFMLYHIAYILKQTSVAQQILTQFVETDDSDYLKKRLTTNFQKWLRITASTGNYTVLGMLLGLPLCDPTIPIDGQGRTALHYAANGSLLDHSHILDLPGIMDFFSTVKDVGDFKMKWEEERRNSWVTFPSRSTNSNSMDEEVQFNVERKACILMLLQAGCDLSQVDKYGKVPNVGPTKDANFQSWWYDLVVKEITDQKNGFNQAGNALSVVGTLVAATSYIGPLQPPRSYTDGLVNIGEKLIEIFMVANTMAFYFGMASVMFAVVPSLPMPRESVMSELKRARHTVSLSLCFLLVATIMIIISFSAASVVVNQDQHYGLRFGPTVIGWIVCILAIVSFLIRVMRLMFFDNPTVKWIYQFSFIAKIKKFGNAIYAMMSNRVTYEGRLSQEIKRIERQIREREKERLREGEIRGRRDWRRREGRLEKERLEKERRERRRSRKAKPF